MARRRLIALAVATTILAACAQNSTATPPLVAPPSSPDNATIFIEGLSFAQGFIEGGFPFVRVLSPAGQIVLEQVFEWPSTTQQLPTGSYQVIVYWRACGGNCGTLDPPSFSCIVEIHPQAREEISITVDYANGVDYGDGTKCEVGR